MRPFHFFETVKYCQALKIAPHNIPNFRIIRLICSFPSSLGGDEENRTPDPLLAKQVLSQLSYTPIAGTRLSSYALLKADTFKIEQLLPYKCFLV